MKRSIGSALKTTAKAKGLTQGEIAKIMKVSLTTVKRWFSGQGLDLERLEALLKLLGLSLKELSDSVGSMEAGEREFSLEQETAFARNPLLLAYFEQLLEGKSPQKLKQTFRLTEKQTSRCLRELERLRFLERHPGGRIKLLFTEQPRWRMDGPLWRRLKKKAIEDFLAENTFKSVRLGLHRMNSDDLTRLETMLIDLQAFARSAETRAKHYPDRSVSIGLLVGCAPFNWSAAS
jgi:transcriptional regulator with XRE-family HTH domain